MNYIKRLFLFIPPIAVFLISIRANAGYDPTIGRWLSRDPMNNAELLQGTNLYSYVFNNPVNTIDPFGLFDLNLIPPWDPAKVHGDITPLSDREFTVGGHGFPLYMLDSNGNYLSADKLASLIKTNPKYDPNKPVRLQACWTGFDLENGVAPYGQQLADALGSTVLAPTAPVGIDSSGNTWLPWGYYKSFSPRR